VTVARSSAVPVTATQLTAVAAGGAVGAVARWSLTEAVPDGAGFPWTTFAINVLGAGLLALLPAIAERRHPLLALVLGPGVLGGFTTFSLYAEQARALVADGSVLLAAAYAVGTLLACLLAVHGATALVRRRNEPDVLS
jgi:CrcB protein